jgi:hypothetical protein
MRRVLRIVLLGPLMVLWLTIFMGLSFLLEDRNYRSYPRWTWQLLWYGEEKAREMR